MRTFHETRDQAPPMASNYGGTYLCRRKSMVVSLGYCEHCAECRAAGIQPHQLERCRDAYA